MSIKGCFRAHILSVYFFQMQPLKIWSAWVSINLPQPQLLSLECLSKYLFVLPNGRKNLDNNKLFWGIFLDTLNIECVETQNTFFITWFNEQRNKGHITSCTVSPTDAQTVGYFYCIVLDIVQDSLSIILCPDLSPCLCLFSLQINMVTIYVNN